MDPDQLTLLALGEPLGDAEDAATTGHLQACVVCRDELRSLRETIGLARDTVGFRDGPSAPPASVWDRIVAEAGIAPTSATRQHPSADLPAPRSTPSTSYRAGPGDRGAGTDPGRRSGLGHSTDPAAPGGSDRPIDRRDPGGPAGPDRRTDPTDRTDPRSRTGPGGRRDLAGPAGPSTPAARSDQAGRTGSTSPSDPAVTGPAGTGPAGTGPAGTGPGVDGPNALGPNALGPNVTGPNVTGPNALGPTGTGRVASGPAATRPALTGPALPGPGPAAPGRVGRHRSPDGPAAAPGGADEARVLPLRRWGTVAVAAVAAAAVGVIGTLAAVRPWAEDPAPVVVASASASLEPVPGGPGGVTGRAVVVRGAAGPRLEVTAAGLPSPEGYYEVWVFDGASRMVSVGTLGPDSAASLPLPATMDLGTFRVVDISAERYDGEQTHSQDSVLRGTLDS